MKAFFKVSTHPLKQLALLFTLYFVLRTLFLFAHIAEWELSFTQVLLAYFHGIQFDGVTIIYANILYLLIYFLPLQNLLKNSYSKIKQWLFVVLNIPFVLLNCIDIAYFSFAGKRITADVLATTKDITNQIGAYLIDFWWIALLLILLIFILYKIGKQTATDKFTSLNKILNFLIWLPFTFLLARGSFGYKPLHIFDANKYVASKNIPLVLNSGFTFLKTLENKPLEELNYFTEKDLEKIYSPKHIATNKTPNNKNVVVIILESFSKEYVGFLNNGIGYTPFLDSLATQSFVFTNCYANAKRSNEGIPAIIAGIPHLMDVNFIVSNYGSNQFNGLGSYLKELNYNTSFFHGGVNGTMNFDSFAKLAGFDTYYGKNEYKGKANDYDGNWGIYDEAYFNFFCNKLNTFKKPFASVFFSLSSHHPYKIPTKYIDKFPKGDLEIHESIGYADYSLSQFFKNASQQSWYNNTLFVITADHTSISNSNFYSNDVGQFQIPLLLFSPGDSALIGEDKLVSQQIDIMPTILNYIGYNKNYFAFGNPLFNGNFNRFAIQQKNGYQLIYNNYVLQYSNENKSVLFNLQSDSLLKHPIQNKNDVNYIASEKKIKAILQTYNYSLINNKMKF